MISQIKNQARFRQEFDLSGLRWGGIYPTDYDCLGLDFNGEIFCFYEFKVSGYPLTIGQNLHLKFLVEALSKPAIAIFATHSSLATDIVDIGNHSNVVAVCTNMTVANGKLTRKKKIKWLDCEDKRTARQVTVAFVDFVRLYSDV